jgi:inhibitor of KinA sporulation pathway (predicted exonuclease)
MSQNSGGSRFAPCPICGLNYHQSALPLHASKCVGLLEEEEKKAAVDKMLETAQSTSPGQCERESVGHENIPNTRTFSQSEKTSSQTPCSKKRSLQLKQAPSTSPSYNKRRGAKKGLDSPVRPYPYLVVLDLEWTCDNEAPVRPFAEIIEFSCVLVDTTNRPARITSQFQRYVKPVHNPTLTAFCIDLTAITQFTVDTQGVSLAQALEDFESWLVSHGVLKNEEQTSGTWSNNTRNAIAPFAVVTWSDADLGSTLPRQSQSYGLSRKPWFDEWINLKLAFSSVYKRDSRGLRRCVEAIGLTFEGRAHSGLVDSQNTAKIALDMINRQNYSFHRATRFLDEKGYMIGSRQSRTQSNKRATNPT